MNITGDAVGVPKTDENAPEEPLFWFIGMTKTNKEKRIRDILNELHYVTYLPLQTEEHEWSQGRKRKINRLILPGYIFVRCTETKRKAVFSDPEIAPTTKVFLSRWMTDRSSIGADGKHAIATVPDAEMQQFMTMVQKSSLPVTIESARMRKGDIVRVKSGELWGCIGELEKLPDNTAKLVIRIPNLGAAKVSVDLNDIEIIKKK